MKKEKQIEIKLYYKCKNKIIKEFRIDKYNVTFGDILDFFYDDIKDKYNQYQLKSKYFFNKKELESKDKILNLLMQMKLETKFTNIFISTSGKILFFRKNILIAI